MSEEFKKRLQAYEKGELDGEDLKKFEAELAKLEEYQSYLEENEREQILTKNKGKQKRILKRSKWKARFQTALSAIGILILLTIVSTILTGLYYTWGDQSRVETFSEVVDHTMTVTDPYGEIGGTGTNINPFFNMKMTRDLNKTVGKESIQVGELNVSFIFSLMGFPERNMAKSNEQNHPAFTYPGAEDRGMSDWNRLEHLPEGTVVSAYVSFNELIGTQEVFEQFLDKDLDITWLAVDTGVDEVDEDFGEIIHDPIGFPSSPIWHEDDMIQDTYEEEGSFFGKVVSESSHSPEYEEGKTDILHKQFLKTMKSLVKHEKKVEKLYRGFNLDLEERIEYLEENGVKHYGVVLTGPTKEILDLQNEEIIGSLEIDEVGFWNWDNA